MDPSTLALLEILAEQSATAPVLLVCTARPEFRAPWPLRAHHAQVTLARLGRRQVRELAGHVASRAPLSEALLDAVVARTDGVPLFVEELTKAVVEGEASGDARQVPATLADSLMERLDRLGPAREVAQIASVIGREFSWRLLSAVAARSDEELRAALGQLADAELTFARGLPPEASYVFKHALVQDTAYGSLLRGRRRELHQRIAVALEAQAPTIRETHPELLAHHSTYTVRTCPELTRTPLIGTREPRLYSLSVSALLLASGPLLAERGERLRTLVPCAAGIALGLSLSAGFWLPAISLTGQIRPEALLTGKFDFHRQFPPLGGVFGYQRFYAVGLLTPLCWAVAAVALRAGRGSARERRVLAWTLAASAACLVLLLPGSAPLWETLPLLPFYQFPWRFLGPLALLTATAAGLAFAMLEGRLPGRARAPAELAVLALCAANALPHLLDARELSPRVRERLPEVLTPANIQREALPATVGDEYLPRTADPAAWLDGVPEGPVIGHSGTVAARVLLDQGAHVELALGEHASGRLELRRFAFPGWRVELDGRPLATEVSARGALLVPVDGGGALRACFVGTPLVRAARVVSGIAGLVWLMLWIGPLIRRARS